MNRINGILLLKSLKGVFAEGLALACVSGSG
jgi:hypothetical protein